MIKNRVRISLDRLTSKNVTGYEVLAIDPVTAIQRRIAVINNPKSQNPIKLKNKLELITKDYTDAYSKAYKLQHSNIIVDQDYGMTVWINGEVLEPSLYALNKTGKQLIIHVILKEDDLIEMEYYIDGVEYEFISEMDEKYVVKPIIDETNVLIGRHNSLI